MSIGLKPRIDVGEKSMKSYVDAARMILEKYGRVFLVAEKRYSFKALKIATLTGKISWYYVPPDGRRVIVLVERREA